MGNQIAITSAQIIEQAPEPRVSVMRFPSSVGIDYNSMLQSIVNMINEDIRNELMPIVESEEPNYVMDQSWFDRISAVMLRIRARWESPQFRQLTEEIARRFVRAVDARSSRSFGIDILGSDEALQTAIQASIFDNVRLIRTIPEQYLNQVEDIVVTNARAGNRSSVIADQLRERFGVTQNRARFIARDQTAKVNSAIAQKRIESAGYEYFQWVTSRDERVRDRHDDISQRVTAYGMGVYRFDNPPLSDRGVPILPGVDFQCRCVMRPISRRMVERNQAGGNVRRGVLR